MTESKQEKLYREELGEQALERVKTTFSTRHPCCWEASAGPHHPVCPNRPKDDADIPPLIEGQETLA